MQNKKRSKKKALTNTVPGQKYRNAAVSGLRIILVLIWAGIILLCFLKRDSISIETILNDAPQNLWGAAFVMLALFALKSLSIIIYSGILYSVNGILFPLPTAILLNCCGTVIMLSIPYFIGRKMGTSAVNYIKAKYPKVEAVHEIRTENDLFFSLIIRIIGLLPCDIVSLYMGAVNVEYKKYLIGGLIGMLPSIINFPVMGMSITDIHSPKFVIAFGIELAFMIGSTVIYAIYWKRHKRAKES